MDWAAGKVNRMQLSKNESNPGLDRAVIIQQWLFLFCIISQEPLMQELLPTSSILKVTKSHGWLFS